MINMFTRMACRERMRPGLGLALAAVLLTGCQSVGYYGQAIHGQFEIFAGRRAISELLADPQTPAALREKLQLVLDLRAFAEKELRLPANGHYLRYVELNRRYVVWSVHAAPEFSLAPKTWWYPVVGSLKYRGYFSEPAARRYAASLAGKGDDVFVEGVEAYSTLGWFRDPVLSTFIHHQGPGLAEVIFHELAHQRVFVGGDTDFDEAFATAVAEEGLRRWLRAANDPAALEKYEAGRRRNDQFVQLIMSARRQLEVLYGEQKGGGDAGKGRGPHASAEVMRQQKERVIAGLRRDYKQLKAQWGGYAGYDDWFAQPLNNAQQSLNNAQLNTVATYYDLVPAFDSLLRANDGDLEKFYREVRKLAKLSKEERHRRLQGSMPAR